MPTVLGNGAQMHAKFLWYVGLMAPIPELAAPGQILPLNEIPARLVKFHVLDGVGPCEVRCKIKTERANGCV